ncbi:MAG: hypothetical protein Q8R00_02710 [Candidatus Nanoarchaeia archaeon]|nr:hypothetical protein [Candidatus Nanoarchaeia archaeon]
MVIRKVNVKRHITALFITILIFVIGLLIGLNLTNERIKVSENFARTQKADYDSLQLQFLYLEKGSCSVLEKTLEQNINDLENQRSKVEEYLKDSSRDEFRLIEREYMLSELRYWLLAKEAKESCNSDTVSILYFYSDIEGECNDCSAQGVILNYLKEKFKDRLLIFSLDINVEDSLLNILKKTENITVLPSLLVEDDKYEGLIEAEDIELIVCTHFKTPHPECNGKL